MTTFKSPDVIVNKTSEELFQLIGNLNNLKEIMPAEIEDYESTETTCSFKIQGIPKLTLEISERIKFSKISLIAKDSQVPLTLHCFINKSGNKCQARIEIEAELNFMMKMMVEKPITQFLNIFATKMKNI